MKPLWLRRLARAGRHFEPTWRYGFNLAPSLLYRFENHVLSAGVTKVLSDLNRNGVAITSVGELLESGSCFQELSRSVEELEDARARDILAARDRSDETDSVGQKTFNVELLGPRPVLDPDNVYARFALQRPILQIANAYFQMYTRLRYFNVWRTFATTTEARESQLWHRDREDHYILKVFVYLSEVDDGAGPFTYAAGSHSKGSLRVLPEYFTEGNVRRSRDEQMARAVPREKWIKCTGPVGTIVFADTHGFHKGGLARERDRLMYICMFTSGASQSVELFESCGKVIAQSDRALQFALSSLPST
jgi:hypothetical protein